MRRVFCGCSPLEESVPPPGFEFPSHGPINQETICAGAVLAALRAYGPFFNLRETSNGKNAV